MTRFLHRFWQDRNGGPAAEFALVAPLLILFLLGIIDVGRLMWTWNQAEKATQMGVRFAAVTDPMPSGLESFSYAVDSSVPQGDVVSQTLFPGITCTSASCTWKPGGSPPGSFSLTQTPGAFTLLVNRMNAFKSDIAAANVVVDYDYSGLGFSGDPNGPDVAPLITVKLTGLTFTPTFLFGAVSLTLPGFSATLSMEDGDGTNSN